MITIHTLSVGTPQTATDERGTWRSAIFRTPQAGPVELGERGLAGDKVADTKNHGSLDQAVCCHPLEHYAFWNEAYALDPAHAISAGAVGENWTIAGANEGNVCVGDVFAVGMARVQVSAPRYPCTKQERKLRLKGFHQRTMETRRTGWYLRVLAPGVLQAGDELRLLERPRPDLTIQLINEHMFGSFDPALSQTLLATPELAAGWKRIIEHKLRS
jgi:MOSC domain-containing protein YiiM